jgi:NADH:ubiquinone oxidoreductase subunit C
MGVMLVNANLLAYAVPSMVNTFLFKDSGSREISIFTSALFPLVLFLKKHTFFRMDQLIDICVVDRLNSSKRFQVIYVLFSSLFQFRVLVHVFVSEDAFLPSLSSLFSNALWLEREV